MDEIKIVKSYRLHPSTIKRIHNAAVSMKISDTAIVQMAVAEYLTRFERRMKREESANG